MKACADKAAELLGRRSHFRRELEHKLLDRGYDGAEVEAALERFEELGYLDDRRTAEQWLAERLARRPEGPARLRAELMRRGADEAVARQAVADAELAEDELGRKAAELWRRRSSGDAAALARHLQRRGFGAGVIAAILRQGEGGV